MRGFVNIYFDPETNFKPTTIITNITKVDNVQFAYIVTGEVDAIAFVDAPDSEAFRDTVMGIRRVKGVLRTSTSVVL